MHLQRGVSFFIVGLLLCLGFSATFVYADDTTNTGNPTILVPLLTQNPGNLSATTLITTTTASASVLPTETPGSPEGSCPDGTPVSDGTCTGSAEQYPVMHFTPEQLEEIYSQMDKAPKISLMGQRGFAAPLLPQSKSLLSYLDYTPAERNQGSCGDCWQWASTGALEIDHAVKNNVKERLSVQYFNSNYHNGAAGYSCCAGWLNYYTSWYNDDPVHRTPVPWSNTNAYFGDLNTACGSATAVPAGTIATTPHYNLTSMTDTVLDTFGVGQPAAIDTIKTEINANKPVWYGFFYNSTGMHDFQYHFWAPMNEDQIYNPDPWAYFSDASYGHAVLIVGYNDTDTNPDNHYWLVLNSWGAPSNRPNGLFRLKMNMNYNATYQAGGYRQQVFEILDAEFISPAPAITGITPSFGMNTSPVSITNLAGANFYGTPAVKLNRTGYPDITATGVTVVDPTNITCTLPITNSPAGIYNVVVMNPDGQEAMLVHGFEVVNQVPDNVGVFRPSTHIFYLRPGTYPASPAKAINWGASTDTPVTGDWNGDESWDVGVFRNSTHKFYLKNGSVTTAVNWGQSTDTPVTGDWNGDGLWDVGVFRNSTHTFYLKNGTKTTSQNWGLSTDTPVTGDWNGDGLWDVGVFRNATHMFYLKNGTVTTSVNWGVSTDLPVTGTW
ncbi:MAG: hypothetical protein LUO98_05900 [Methanoregula sp.]|nr:hypothetical protein [Methanoregula sp.]